MSGWFKVVVPGLAGAFFPLSALAATVVVNTTADTVADDGVCSLREAALAVNTDTASGLLQGECAAGDAGTDLVLFALPPHSIIAAAALPFVFEQSVDIRGPAADHLTLSIGALDRVMIFDASASHGNFSLSGVTLLAGAAIAPYMGRFDDTGGGLAAIQPGDLHLSGVRFLSNSAERFGGGAGIEMLTGGQLVIEDCIFEDNRVFSPMGGGGGGLVLTGVLSATLRRNLFVGNRVESSGVPAAEDPDGGALVVGSTATGSLTVENSTFVDNRAHGEGGAIMFGSSLAAIHPAVVTLLDSLTIAGNLADADGDSANRSGGGVYAELSDELVTLRNTIVATNQDLSVASSPDVDGDAASLASDGFNWIGIRAGAGPIFPAGQPNAGDDWVGTLAAPLDPQLQPLGSYGGSTQSRPPVEVPASAVLDAGSCPAALHDQRDWQEPSTGLRAFDEPILANADDGCDIGAVESFLPPPPEIFVDGFEGGGTGAWSAVLN